MFKYFSSKQASEASLTEDVTLLISEVINVLAKCKLIDSKVGITQEDAVKVIEQYFAKGTRLQDKLEHDLFIRFYKENPLLLQINREIDARRKKNADIKKRRDEHDKMLKKMHEEDPEATQKVEPFTQTEEPEIDDEIRRAKEEEQLAVLKEQWHKDVVSKHLIYVKGVEICFFEFKEILLAFACQLREKIDPKTGKLKVVLTKFIEDWILPRLQSFVKFKIPTSKLKADASRAWPESQKDLDIKVIKQEQQKKAQEELKKKAERDRQAAELARMAEEDTPALDWKEIEALRKKKQEEEEAERRAREALEEGEDEED